MSDKKALRLNLKNLLSKLSKDEYEDLSNQIATRLFNDEDWKQAKVIGITISKFPEVDTYRIIKEAWEQGKQVAAPKCIPMDRKMSFRLITEFSQLESVFYGLLEPVEELTKEINQDEIDLLIVPGLGYTKEGFRIGFGGGYYDRYLKTYSGKTVSLAFHSQIIPTFIVDQYDLPVAKIITDDEVIIVK